MNDSLKTKEDVIALVQTKMNEVYDPCGLARGLSIGMVDMGLICSINVEPVDNAWKVFLRIRFTSAGCEYFPYFEREIRERLEVYQQIESISLEWDKNMDWTPDNLSKVAKSKLEEHNEKLLSAALQRQQLR
ncbi:hypothetical protein QUB80_28770 [Chlorogloeopsis sp. ULAP01]|jgi:metal-sulfur cluster biosynthetic enzyme|uniref:metal-sulfur cluster assembly factor n=1 Tax=Chlorogloeopsis sp. ULAP01 TaxID=3056483 RepID=UPI0025AA802D|nr:hypothetical protein [Chlorogloeopsis sp. ULAP01]MDM9384662.1 hypothetical protein [Chlorogloeopsis sp. ULAP01]